MAEDSAPRRGLFVTGTDTEVGKTVISAGLVHALGQRGLRVCGLKPVASGCLETPDGLRNEDALALQAAANVELAYETINPYAFVPPIAPHVAAARAHKTIDPAVIDKARRRAAEVAEVVVMEGVGGWLVPLGPDTSVADMAVDAGMPVVLVVGLRLGCINHALLTAESVRARGLTIAGWVANALSTEMAAAEEVVAAIDERIGAPLRGQVPFMAEATPQQVAACLDREWLATV